MTNSEHLADLRERFGPTATRVGDPPTAGDVELLLRLLDQPKCVDDAKVAEIRQRAKSHRAMDRTDRTMYATAVIDAMLDDIDTLLSALDAERDGLSSSWQMVASLVKSNAEHRKGFRLRDMGEVGILSHLRDEYVELCDSPNDVNELADVLAIAFHYAIHKGWSEQAVASAIASKLRQRFPASNSIARGEHREGRDA